MNDALRLRIFAGSAELFEGAHRAPSGRGGAKLSNFDAIRAHTERLRAQIEESRLEVERRRLFVEEAKLKSEYDKMANDARRASFEAVIKFADMTVRSLLILNGGAALAMLTFAANKSRDGAGFSNQALAAIVMSFGIGALLSVVTAGFSYLAQSAFTDADDSRAKMGTGRILQGLAVLAALAGLAAFSCGVWQASARLKETARPSSTASQYVAPTS